MLGLYHCPSSSRATQRGVLCVSSSTPEAACPRDAIHPGASDRPRVPDGRRRTCSRQSRRDLRVPSPLVEALLGLREVLPAREVVAPGTGACDLRLLCHSL